MTDTTSRPSVVPEDPQYKYDSKTVEHAGITWYWDRFSMWWPTQEIMRVSLHARNQRNQAGLNHAYAVRALEIEVLQQEHDAGGVPSAQRPYLHELKQPMVVALKALDAHKRSSRNGWIIAFAIVLSPVLLMGGCAAKQAVDVAHDTAVRQENGVWRCQERVRTIADPDTVEFSQTEGYGTDGVYVEGDMVRTSDGVSTKGTYECRDRPVETGGWMMHVDNMVGL